MNRAGRWIAFLASLGAFALLVALLVRPGTPGAVEAPLLVYCGSGIRVPVEAAVKAYGRPVQLQFGGSQTLLASVEASGMGDIFIPGDDSYLRKGQEKELVAETVALASMQPVLAVRKGNPKSIRGVEDVLREGVVLSLPNPDAAAVGKITREALQKDGSWARLVKAAKVSRPTVSEVATDIKLGAADAGFIWDATLVQYPDLERVEVAALSPVRASLSAGVLTSAKHPAASLRFARFLAGSAAEFAKAGFQPAGGDAWEETPEIRMYSGAMLRPAIEKTIQAFEAREGAKVTRVYNGCGILVAQMKAGERPDLYFACDESFMKEVQELFEPSQPVSLNQLVILVHKGNPKGVKSLKDLGKPGLRLGIGHEKQCALGVLTQETLAQTKLREPIMKNVVVQTPTGDMLVNQLRTGTLDAAVAYVSNATGSADLLEAIPVNVPCALATQPIAVGLKSGRKQIAHRLVDALRSVESRQRFEEEGFKWKAAQ